MRTRITVATLTFFALLATACSSPEPTTTPARTSTPEPRVEDFADLLVGLWHHQPTGGRIRFEGRQSGVVTFIAPDGRAEGANYEWTSPTQISTTLPGDSEFSVLFESGSAVLVLSTISGASRPAVFRYERVE